MYTKVPKSDYAYLELYLYNAYIGYAYIYYNTYLYLLYYSDNGDNIDAAAVQQKPLTLGCKVLPSNVRSTRPYTTSGLIDDIYSNKSIITWPFFS